jgi:hypothetical protein
MKNDSGALRIPMQVGSEVRVKNTGEVVVDNPEIELANDKRAADAVLSYRFDRAAGEHIFRLLDPVADHQHVREHRRDD